MKIDKRKGRIVKVSQAQIIKFIEKHKFSKNLKDITLKKFDISKDYYYKIVRRNIINIKPKVIYVSFTVSIHTPDFIKFKNNIKKNGLKINDFLKRVFYDKLGVRNDLEFNKLLIKNKNFKKLNITRGNAKLEIHTNKYPLIENNKINYPVMFLPKITLRPFSNRNLRKI